MNVHPLAIQISWCCGHPQLKVGVQVKFGWHSEEPPEHVPQFCSVSIPEAPDVAMSRFGADPHLDLPVGTQAQTLARVLRVFVEQVGFPLTIKSVLQTPYTYSFIM